jgi:hypothetical protein
MMTGQETAEEIMRPEDALRRGVHDLHVEADQEVQLSAEGDEHRGFFARVQLQTIADLQVLGLVPRELPEEELRKAIAEDDEVALQTARELLLRGAKPPCSCEPGLAAGREAERPYARQLSQVYGRVRRTYNPSLARLVSGRRRTSLAWDSTAVSSVRGWIARIDASSAVSSILAALSQDIVVKQNATLVLDPKTPLLLARSIRIHQTGRIVHRGGYLRIWAAEIVRLHNNQMVTDKVAPWRLA